MINSKKKKIRYDLFCFFKFRPKRKENQEDNRTIKSVGIQPSQDTRPAFYPPPPPAFSSRQESTLLKPQNVQLENLPSNLITFL